MMIDFDKPRSNTRSFGSDWAECRFNSVVKDILNQTPTEELDPLPPAEEWSETSKGENEEDEHHQTNDP